MIGFSHIVRAERLSRAQCLSRSGVTPSKARAPSNTLEASQKAWLRGPRIGRLPSNHSSSRKVKVCDQSDIVLGSRLARGLKPDIGPFVPPIKPNLDRIR